MRTITFSIVFFLYFILQASALEAVFDSDVSVAEVEEMTTSVTAGAFEDTDTWSTTSANCYGKIFADTEHGCAFAESECSVSSTTMGASFLRTEDHPDIADVFQFTVRHAATSSPSNCDPDEHFSAQFTTELVATGTLEWRLEPGVEAEEYGQPVKVKIFPRDGVGTALGWNTDFKLGICEYDISVTTEEEGKEKILLSRGPYHLVTTGPNTFDRKRPNEPPEVVADIGDRISVSYRIELQATTSNPAEHAKIDVGSAPGFDHGYTINFSLGLAVSSPPPVILVHGWRPGNEQSGGEFHVTTWDALEEAFKDKKHMIEFYPFTYATAADNATGDPRRYAKQLSEKVRSLQEETGREEFTIVCHSMGALVTRWYMEKLGGAENVEQWIGVAPVSHGAAITLLHWMAPDWLGNFFDLPGTKVSVHQMMPTSKTVEQLDDEDGISPELPHRVLAGANISRDERYRGIGGGRTLVRKLDREGHPYAYYTYQGDGVVALQQSKLSGNTNNTSCEVFDGIDHTSILKSSHVVDKIIEYVKDPDLPLESACPDSDPVDDRYAGAFGNRGTFTAGEYTPHSITVDEGVRNMRIILTHQAERGLELSLTPPRPSGETVGPGHASVTEYFENLNTVWYEIEQPEAGTWNLNLAPEQGGLDNVEYAFRVYFDTDTVLDAGTTDPPYHQVGDTATIKASLRSLVGNSRLLRALPSLSSVTATLFRPDGNSAEVQLFDDGTHNEGAVGDGTFGARVTLASPGHYAATITAVGEGGCFQRATDLSLWAWALPDLAVTTADIAVSPAQPDAGEEVTIGATIRSLSDVGVQQVPVRAYVESWDAPEDPGVLGEQAVNVAGKNSTLVEFPWVATGGMHEIRIVISGNTDITESSYTNNDATIQLSVRDAVPTDSDTDVGPIDNGQTIEATIDNPGDLDAAYLAVVAGDTLQARMGCIDDTLETHIELYDPYGERVAEDSVFYQYAEVTHTATNSGIYTVICKGDGVSTGRYTVAATLFGGHTPDDIDNDGVSNVDELTAWTDPFDPDSFLHITRIDITSTNGPTIEWQTVGSMRYRVQYSDDLKGDDFTDIPRLQSHEVEHDVGEGQMGHETFTDSFTPPQGSPTDDVRFYNVRIVQ